MSEPFICACGIEQWTKGCACVYELKPKKEHIIYDYIDKLPCRICGQKIYGRWILNYKHASDNNICYACYELENKK